MKSILLVTLLAFAALLAGCKGGKQTAEPAESTVQGDTIAMPPGLAQLAALTVEPIVPEKQSFVPLTARLVWDENATVRVFTPFAGIVRRLLAEVNEPVTKGMPLAEIQSA